jgi:hypothetical protein
MGFGDGKRAFLWLKQVNLILGQFIGDSWLRTMPKSMSSTRRLSLLAPRITFRRARGWNTTPAEYYPGYYAADVFDPDGYSFEVVHKS